MKSNRRRDHRFILPLMVFAMGADAEAQPVSPPPIGLARIVSSIPRGAPWADIKGGHLVIAVPGACYPAPDGSKTVPWNAGPGEVNLGPYIGLFASALKDNQLTPADDPDNLLKREKSGTDLLVAANIKSVKATICVPSSRNQQYWNFTAASGNVTFVVEWQLYSVIRDEVIYRSEVTSEYKVTAQQDGNIDRLIQGGISENIRNFAKAATLKTAIMDVAAAPQSLSPSSSPRVTLSGSLKQAGAPIGDAVGSVVLIMAAGGHGSGFLVSTDGYLMTAEHVVGSDKYVKIRWSDGLEGVGEVIRTDKRRDVALVKTDPRGRQPLALHRAAPQPGDTVFAIGAPLDTENQGTVTRGVASANRIMDGFSFIQSDVTINGGNSGGPLLDEKGQVLGIADLSLRERGNVPTGINYFVPIDDALRFLSVEPQ